MTLKRLKELQQYVQQTHEGPRHVPVRREELAELLELAWRGMQKTSKTKR